MWYNVIVVEKLQNKYYYLEVIVMAVMNLTKGGIKSAEQAKAFGLAKYYDEYMGHYIIPEHEADNEIMAKVRNLLCNGKSYDKEGNVNTDGELVMSYETLYEDGEPVEGKFELFIREVETFC